MTSHLPRVLLGVLAVLTLVLSAGGALGVWPTGAPPPDRPSTPSAADEAGTAKPPESVRPAAARTMTRDMEGPNGDVSGADPGGPGPAAERRGGTTTPQQEGAAESDAALPARSGTGRRVVFDMGRQQVWLVGSAGRVHRSYPVSGSETDNLAPGRYEVYSRSRHAVSYTYEETMQYMVRFAHGDNAAIGFHDIPVDQRGRPLQTVDQLGQRLSSGCIRQARPDAIALWKFADVGTRVVVVG